MFEDYSRLLSETRRALINVEATAHQHMITSRTLCRGREGVGGVCDEDEDGGVT